MTPHDDATYRDAFGLASRLADARRLQIRSGTPPDRADAGGAGESILTAVLRRFSFPRSRGRELMAQAVHDALSRRRPRP